MYLPMFRRKGNDINKKVITLNKVLSEEVFLNGFDYIDNDSILYSNLCNDGLHINEGGARKFVLNLLNFIKYCWGFHSSNVARDTNPPKANNTRKRNGLKIAFLNIVSLRKHRDELGVIHHDNDIDIIGLSETRLSAAINDSNVMIEGYNIYRNDRNQQRGWSCFLCKINNT